MADPRTVAKDFAEDLHGTLGEDLRSVVLYGSVAREESIPGISDVNLMIRVNVIGPPFMARVAPRIQEWVKWGNTPPHVFSEEEWAGMGDTFAIEIADMRDAREVIHGEDPIPSKELAHSDLRLHAEREIRDTIQHLRLRMYLYAGNPRGMGSLLLAGIPSFSAYMRTALRLHGERPPTRTEDVIGRTGEVLDVDVEPLLRCQKARREIRPPEVQMVGSPVEGYLAFVDRLMNFIDTLPPHGAGISSGTAATSE